MNCKVFGGWMCVVFLGLTGCAHVKPVAFLADEDLLSKGEYLDKVYVAPDLKLGSGETVLLPEPSIAKLPDNPMLPPKTAQSEFEGMLQEWLTQQTPLKVGLEREVADPASYRYELVTAITDLNPGSKAMRWFAGEFGAGHSKVQVEGYLKDLKTQKILFQFADRRAGSASGGMDITGGDGRQLLNDDLDNIAKSIAKTLSHAV